MSTKNTFSKEKRLPRNLIKAILKARETSVVQRKFQEEMQSYLDKCKRERLTPKNKWLCLLQYLAEGKDIMSILEAIQVHPDSEEFLKFLEVLKAHDFPVFFIDDLISEIPSDYLSLPRKDRFRSQLGIYLDF